MPSPWESGAPMPLKTILWAGFFVVTALGALWNPLLGIIGYVGHYCIGPDTKWWTQELRPLGLRYSFTLAIMTGLGIAVNWHKLRPGRTLLSRQEKLVLLFLGLVWLSVLIGPETTARYTKPGIDHPSVKFTKVLIFGFMLTHVVTTRKNLDRFVWVLVLGALILGAQAWDTPRRAFLRGRLEGVGGPDFTDANAFGVFMAAMLPLIGVQFLRSRWPGKVLAFLAGGFTANAVVLARSRGAFLALAGGVLAAALTAPRRHRGKIALGIVLAVAGGFSLTDPQFIHRMSTITTEEEEMGGSAHNRIEIWRGGLRMLKSHPLGVGAGNFYQTIGRYAPEHAGRDAHNTYVRTACELGVQGIAVFGLLAIGALGSLWRIGHRGGLVPGPERRRRELLAYGLLVSVVVVLGGCLTLSLTYVEYVWWFLLLPVCLARSVENYDLDAVGEAAGEQAGQRAPRGSSASPERGKAQGQARRRPSLAHAHRREAQA